MPEDEEHEELQLLLPRLRQQRHLLPVPELPPVLEATARLLLPERRGEYLRPQLPSLRQSLETVTGKPTADEKGRLNLPVFVPDVAQLHDLRFKWIEGMKRFVR